MANNEVVDKKKSNFKLIYIIIAIIILISSFTGAFLLSKTVFNPQKTDAVTNELGPLFNPPEVTVNLANTNGRRFLMAQFSVEVDDKKVLDELEDKSPVLQDTIIMILSSQTIEDLNSIQGKEKIKKQLKDNINDLLFNGKVINIYFNKLVWQ